MNIVILCVSLLVVLICVFSVRRKLQKQVLRQVLYCLPTLHSMIGQMQKHRGLNASLLQGKQDTISAIKGVQDRITQISSDLKGYNILTNMERWDAYIDHWSRLENNHQSISVAESFTQHTALIENVLYLLEDLANTTQNMSRIEVDTNHVTLLWRELPLLVEFVGQTRAIGMAIVTKQEMSQIDRIKLGYLRDKVDKTSTTVFDALLKDTYSSNQSHLQLESAISVCANFLNMLDKEFFEADQITLIADDYFNAASEVMNTINKILDFEMEKFTQNA